MSLRADIAVAAWFLVAFAIFAFYSPKRAVVIASIAAWCFLPLAHYGWIGFHGKSEFTSVGLLLGSLLFAPAPWKRLRPRLLDLPMIVFCTSPFISSVNNDLGYYDALSVMHRNVLAWGIPYLLGRVYLGDLQGLRELATGIFAGGLVYVPLCLWEIRMSPQLHRLVYGWHQHSFEQTVRLGGWRPMVFMNHGLMVGMWMTAASLCGFWLWRTRAVNKVWGVPIAWLLPVLLVTTVLCKSTGALILLALGYLAFVLIRRLRTTVPVLLLVAAAVSYMAVRSTGNWSGDALISISETYFSAQRADSLRTRLENEDLLAAKAMQKEVFGWGRWGRSRIYDESGKDIAITDGLWIIVLGEAGLVGLSALTAAILLPVLSFRRRYGARLWSHPLLAPAAALSLLLALYMIDDIFNAMVNPIFALAMGALVGFLGRARRGLRAVVVSPPAPVASVGPPLAAARSSN